MKLKKKHSGFFKIAIHLTMSAILAFLITVQTPATARAAVFMPVRIFINKTEFHIPYERIGNFGEIVLVSLEDFCEVYGASYTENNEITISKGEYRGKLSMDSNVAYAGKNVIRLAEKPEKKDGKTMVPISYLAEVFHLESNFKNSVYNLNDAPPQKEQKVAEKAQSQIAGEVELSYRDAVKAAIDNNSSLKTLEESVEYLDAKSKDTNSNLSLVIATQDFAQITAMLRGINALDSQSASAPYNKSIIEGTTEYLVRNTLTNIVFIKMDMNLLEEMIRVNETNVNNNKLKQSLGMASDFAVRTAEKELEKNQLSLAALKINLEIEYQNLNKLLGKDLKSRIFVPFTPESKTFSNTSLNGDEVYKNFTSYMNKKVSEAPTYKIKDQALKQAEKDNELGEQLLNPKDPSIKNTELDKLERTNNLNKAQREKADTIKELESAMNKAFSNLKQLDENVTMLELELSKARENHETMLVNFHAGNVIKYEVDQLLLAILKCELDLAKNAYNKSNLLFLLENPFLLAQK